MKNSIPLGFIRIFILLICLTSWGRKKQKKVAFPADFKGPKELARLYGVRITPEDNIFLYNEGARWLGVVINWEGARNGAWIAPVSYRSFIGRYTESSWLVPRRIC